MFKGKEMAKGRLTALLPLLFSGTGRNPGAETLYSLQARLPLPYVPRGYGKVGCQKSSWGTARPVRCVPATVLARTRPSRAFLRYHAVSELPGAGERQRYPAAP